MPAARMLKQGGQCEVTDEDDNQAYNRNMARKNIKDLTAFLSQKYGIENIEV